MRILISLCTRHRDESLATCLAALGRLHAPSGLEVEICVTVNEAALRPETAAVIDAARAAGSYPVTVLAEPRPGIPFARNRGLEHALDRGFTHVAFLDDDAWPERTWLVWLIAGLDHRYCAAAGPQLPVFPEGMRGSLSGTYTFTERKLPDGAETDRAATNNALVDLAPVRKFGIRFDPDFADIGGEDTFFFVRMTAASGRKIVWAARARVHEPVTEERFTWGWALSRNVKNGKSDALVMRKTAGRTVGPALALRRSARAVAEAPLALIAAAFGRRPAADAVLRAAYAWGCLAGAFRRPGDRAADLHETGSTGQTTNGTSNE